MAISVEIHKMALTSNASGSNWNLETVLFFCGERKTEVPGEKPPEQGREPATKSTHVASQIPSNNMDFC